MELISARPKRSDNMRAFILVLIFTFFSGSLVFAEQTSSAMTEEKAITFLQEAYNVQVSLTEKEREIEEIDQMLSSFFTTEFRDKFINENVVKVEEGYIVYATDFPINVIPFYQYDLPFKFYTNDEKILIYQFFPASTEGPVSYDDHYEAVYFVREEGKWKINNIEFSFEEPSSTEFYAKNVLNEEKKESHNIKGKSIGFEQTIEEHLGIITKLTFLPSYFVTKYLLFS